MSEDFYEAEHRARCDLIDAMSWLEVWIAHGPPTQAEREHVESFVKHLHAKYPHQKGRLSREVSDGQV